MSFFRKKLPKEDVAKIQQMLCLAESNPEPIFNLSECHLHKVPNGVFSKCKVYRKDTLLLHSNHLTSVDGGGKLSDLAMLTCLDLHSNCLTCIPDDIGALVNLKRLDISENKISLLPKSFEKFGKLDYLDISRNAFKLFPVVLCSLSRLKTLKCTENAIAMLPNEFYKLVSLEVFDITLSSLTYPPSTIATQGAKEIRIFLCKESGINLNELPSVANSDDSNTAVNDSKCIEESEITDNAYEQVFAVKEQRRQRLVVMEAQLQETQAQEQMLVAARNRDKSNIINHLVREDAAQNEAFVKTFAKRVEQNQKLLEYICETEKRSKELVSQVRKSLADISVDKENDDNLAEAFDRHLDLNKSRKEELMTMMLESLKTEPKIKEKRPIVMDDSSLSQLESQAVEKVLREKQRDHQSLLSTIEENEQLQREAFLKLQRDRDVQHRLVVDNIHDIERELSCLTLMEFRDAASVRRRDELAESRRQLAVLLEQLLERKRQREQFLVEQLASIDRRQTPEDFWFIQYQRLLDSRPKAVKRREKEYRKRTNKTGGDSLGRLLEEADAVEYTQILLKGGVDSVEKLRDLDDCDLVRLGVRNEDVLERIRDAVERWSGVPSAPYDDEPSAPSDDDLEWSADGPQPSAPPKDVKLWSSAECVICMEAKTLLVFLPCGHVCGCVECSISLTTCPLCRETISTKLNLICADE